VRETVTSLTRELFCLDSRNNFVGAPVNYDLKKHRASAFAAKGVRATFSEKNSGET
jgi:hypothetical protein